MSTTTKRKKRARYTVKVRRLERALCIPQFRQLGTSIADREENCRSACANRAIVRAFTHSQRRRIAKALRELGPLTFANGGAEG